MIPALPADAGIYVLSEGPVWDPATGLLSWVDIEAGLVLSAALALDAAGAPRLGDVTRIELGEQVGFAVPLTQGRFLVGLTRQLAVVDASGIIEKGSVLLPDSQRFNDGKIDPQGRLLVGTLWLEGSGAGNSLYRLEPDGTLTTLDDDLGLSNGLGWSPDGSTLYSIDTDASVIYARPYGVGEPGPRERRVELADGVWPDGMTVDAEGSLWVAIWGGSGVLAFGADGTPLTDTGVSIQAPHSSSVTFAGADLDIIVVTSASRDLSDEERVRWPAAGGLHLVKSHHRGQPATRWIDTPLP